MSQILKYKLIGTSLIFMVFLGAGMDLYANENRDTHTVLSSTNNPPRIAEVHPFFAIDLNDDRVLMGASHNVFVGRVVSQIATIAVPAGSNGTLPVTQFSVEPVLNIKGNLQGTVTVEQFGGYQNGVLYVTDGGDAFVSSNASVGGSHLMRPGSTYLFTTRYQNDGAYYLWAAPPASKLISQDSNLSNNQLQALAESDERVQQLQAAYPNEVLVADDVRTGNTRNSYVSTHTPPPTPPSAPSSTEEINPPIISNLASVVASTSITISWTTNKPATSQLLFGSSTAMTAAPFDATSFATSHSRRVSDLEPGMTYYYEVQSNDSSGKTGNSAQQSFTTSGQSSSTQLVGPN